MQRPIGKVQDYISVSSGTAILPKHVPEAGIFVNYNLAEPDIGVNPLGKSTRWHPHLRLTNLPPSACQLLFNLWS